MILAVNGYAGNAALVRRFCPEIAGAHYFGALGSTGEAVLWGEALGAALANIGAYQGYAAVADPHGSLLSWTTIEKGGMLVDATGRRFGDESLGYSGFTPNVLARGRSALRACSTRRSSRSAALEEEFVELARYGGLKAAATRAGSAKLLRHRSLPAWRPPSLDAQRSARGGRADAFGRKDFGLAPLSQRLYGCRVVPGLFHTQGGLDVDLDGRVLEPRGQADPEPVRGGGARRRLSGRSGARRLCVRQWPAVGDRAWVGWRGLRRQPRSGSENP